MKKITFFLFAVLFFAAHSAHALNCEPPVLAGLSTTACDSMMTGPALYRDSNRQTAPFCVVEPLNNSETRMARVDEEVTGNSLCILGKFQSPTSLRRVVDMNILYNLEGGSLLPPMMMGDAPELFSDLIPFNFSSADLLSARSTGEFRQVIPLPQPGVYSVNINARVLNDRGGFEDYSFIRRVLKTDRPQFTVVRARTGGNCPANPMSPDPSTCFRVNAAPMGDSDGDGICDGDRNIPGLCRAGPDTTPNSRGVVAERQVQIRPPERGMGIPEAVNVSKIELCVRGPDSGDLAGSVQVTAENRIEDRSVTPSRTLTLHYLDDCPHDMRGYCTISTDSFCPSGVILGVPVGHGINMIDLQVGNAFTGATMMTNQLIRLTPFEVDLKGPRLVVNYYKTDGTLLRNVDNKTLLVSEVDGTNQVLMDVEVPSTESLTGVACDPMSPPDCGTSSLCIQRNGERTRDGAERKVSLCSVSPNHYRVLLNNLRFPMNLYTLEARDSLGNTNSELHTFGYGYIRRVLNNVGQLDLDNAMTPKAIAGFVPRRFVVDEIRPLLATIINSPKFKNEFFPRLLDPQQPTSGPDSEIECLRNLGSRNRCEYNHLANQERIVAIKYFCNDTCLGENCNDRLCRSNRIGNITVPQIEFVGEDRVRLALHIQSMRGAAEMYTLRVDENTDRDGFVNTKDDDADNDEICDRFVFNVGDCTDQNNDDVCDEEVGLSGERGYGLRRDTNRCVLDKRISCDRCPDVDASNCPRRGQRVKRYWGCSDQDDDNDRVNDFRDLPGHIEMDPDYATHTIPLRFNIQNMTIYLDAILNYDSQGKLHLQIEKIPPYNLVSANPIGGSERFLLELQCDKPQSQLFSDGRQVEITDDDRARCRALEILNRRNPDAPARRDQGTNKQFYCTMDAVLQCSTPKRLEGFLDTFDQEPVMSVSPKLLGKKFHMSLFSPLRKAEVRTHTRGLSFGGKGVLLPGGVTDATDTSEHSAKVFMDGLMTAYPEILTREVLGKFGYLSATNDNSVDLESVSNVLSSDFNLGIKEETINSTLHSVGLLLWDLLQKPESDNHFVADMDETTIRENFELYIPERGGGEPCYGRGDRDRRTVNLNDSWECFPFVLDVNQLLGNNLNYVDFDNNQRLEPNRENRAPVLIRSGMNPFSPPVVKLMYVSPPDDLDAEGSSVRTNHVTLELEVDLGLAPMALYEKEVTQWGTPERPERVVQGANIFDWCDRRRFPEMNSERCRQGKKMPIVVFGMAGKISATVELDVGTDGILRIRGGVTSVPDTSGVATLDQMKTDLRVSVFENNTIIPDNNLVTTFKTNLNTIVEKYLFDSRRQIQLSVPVQLPLSDFCAHERFRAEKPELCRCVQGINTPQDNCDLANTVTDLWDGLNLQDFGLEGVKIVHPVMDLRGVRNQPRYLSTGVNIDFDLYDLSDILRESLPSSYLIRDFYGP